MATNVVPALSLTDEEWARIKKLSEEYARTVGELQETSLSQFVKALGTQQPEDRMRLFQRDERDRATFHREYMGEFPDPTSKPLTMRDIENASREFMERRSTWLDGKPQPYQAMLTSSQYDQLQRDPEFQRAVYVQVQSGAMPFGVQINVVEREIGARPTYMFSPRVELEAFAQARQQYLGVPSPQTEVVESEAERAPSSWMRGHWKRIALYRACDVCSTRVYICERCGNRGYYSRPCISVETLRARATPAFTMVEVLPLP